MNRKAAVLLMLAMLPWAGAHAQSQSVSATFKVQAKVEAVCVVSASDLNLGSYTGASQLTGTTVLRATCTPGSSYNVGLNEGTTPGATVNQRKMASGTNALNYQLYSDAARTSIWGNTPGTDTVSGVGTGLSQDHLVYGAVPAAQVVPAGDYADTVTVRIYY